VRNRRKSDEHQKTLIKEAIKEWLDDKFMQMGRWSFWGIAAFILAGLTYMIFKANGWRVVQ